MTNERELAWSEIHELLPPGWRVPSGAQRDPTTGDWRIAAIGPKRGGRRGPPPDSLIGGGADEGSALVDLVLKLRERGKAQRLAEIDRRRRLAFVAGAEEQSQRAMGRSLTGDELDRIVDAFPPTSDVR